MECIRDIFGSAYPHYKRISVPASFSDQRTRITDFSDQCAHIFLRIIVPVIFSDQCTRVIASGSVYPSVLRISVPVGITDQRTRQ
jgi:hypothetical protein